MLDGLDEIGNPTARRDLRDAVWAAFDMYPKCRWLLTSRIVGYEDVSIDKHFFTNVQIEPPLSRSTKFWVPIAQLRYIAPFDDTRVEQFADNWFMWRENSELTWRTLAKELVGAVRADDSTTKLGRIPNLLTMMALIYRIEAQLPHGRARLYAKIAQAYLETIDKWRKLQRTTEEWADRRRWLARVGFEMQRQRTARDQYGGVNKEILASGEEVRGWIAAEMAVSGKTIGEHDAAEFVEYLAKRSGLLLPRGQDQFGFLHLSFQEYFAASFLMDQIVSPDWKDGGTEGIATGATSDNVGGYANDSVWRETLVFLVELMAVEQPKWLKTLRTGLFGVDLAGVSIPEFAAAGEDSAAKFRIIQENWNRVILLARLAIDPSAGFEAKVRELALHACCRWEIAVQQVRGMGNISWYMNLVARTLLTVDQSERQATTTLLVEVTQEFGATLLDLSGTGVSDLSPLAGLSGLNVLDLGICKQLRNLSPLAGLGELKSLNLNSTPVRDLLPLAGLSALTTLDLTCTPVSDLSPLAGLSGLTTLELSLTKVSHLSSLAGMSELAWLNFVGTPVTDLSPLAELKNFREIQVSTNPNMKVPSSLENVIKR